MIAGYATLGGLLCLVLAAVFGYLLGARRIPTGVMSDTELLAFLETTGYSLQCVNSLWVVTEGTTVVGLPGSSPREAITSVVATRDLPLHGAGNV